MEGTLLGRVIPLKNDSGEDRTPDRFVMLKDGGTFDKPSGEGGDAIGILQKDLRYEDGKVGDGNMGDVQIDGIADVEISGAVTAKDYLIVAANTGVAKSIGALASLSLGAGGDSFVKVVGIALEDGDDGGKVACLLIPNLIVKA